MPEFLNKLLGRQSSPQPLAEDIDLEQFFTDAEPACQAFEDLVSATRLPKRLLVVHGVGGVGKSTLLKMYRLFCYRHQIPVALVGAEDAPSSVDVLTAWADDLSETGIKFSTFPATVAHYHALQIKVESRAANEALMQKAPEREQLIQLRQILTSRFDEGELRTLCFDLGVDYDGLPGDGKINKARELVAYLERRSRVFELAEIGKRLRPDIPWDDALAGTTGATAAHYSSHSGRLSAAGQSRVKRAAGELSKATAKTAVEMAAGAIPVVGPLAAALGGAGTEAAVDWLRGFLSKPDLEFYLASSARLTEDFVKDLTRAADRQRITLMLDTYEQMITLDHWTRDLARQLPKNVLFVIAGRAVPEWERDWQGWMGRAEIVELKEMIYEDLSALVHRYYAYVHSGDPAPEQVEAIVKFARGLPIAATTVVQLWVKHGIENFDAVKSQVVADLADRLLEGVPPEMRPVFEAAAVLRAFNADSLGTLLDEGNSDELYAELRRWPFIRPQRGSLAVHDTMREMVNEALYTRSPDRFQMLHGRAAAFFETQREKLTGAELERATLELLYHNLYADESHGILLLERLFEEADRIGQRELKSRLLGEASHHPLKDPQNRYRLRFLRARMEENWSERERLYKELLSGDLDEALQPAVLRNLAECLSFQHKPEEARRYLQDALELCERLGNPIETAWTRLEFGWRIDDLDENRNQIILALDAFREAKDEYGMAVAELELGYNDLNRWQAAKARGAFTRSMTLQEKLGHRRAAAIARERIGQAYLIEGDFPRAIAAKEKALKSFEELQDEWYMAWTLDELATCYVWTGQWQLALASLERAQIIFAAWDDHREAACVVRQGQVYRRQGRLDLALETYERALNTMPRHNVWETQEIYAGMGQIHLIRGEFKEALDDFRQAVAEFEAAGRELETKLVGEVYLGDLWLAQGRVANAVEHYRISLKTARSIGNFAFESLALVGLCRANYEQGKSDRLDPMIARVEELGKKYDYHQLLADVHALQGHMALNKIAEDPTCGDTAVRFYQIALEDALHYNRYKLDEIVQAIIDHCRKRGEGGQRVLATLIDFWQAGVNDDGIPLLEAERVAREREPGDGLPQVTVVEKMVRSPGRMA